MKKRTMTVMLMGLGLVTQTAWAEMLSGTVTAIDPSAGKVTLMRSDTRDSVTIAVKDQESLAALQTGSAVTLDVNRRLFGGWETQSVDANANVDSGANVAIAPTEGINTNTGVGSSTNPSGMSMNESASQVPDAPAANSPANVDGSMPSTGTNASTNR